MATAEKITELTALTTPAAGDLLCIVDVSDSTHSSDGTTKKITRLNLTNRTVATDDVSDPPTDGELDSAFGTPATVGDGFLGLVDDDGAGTKVWLCVALNSKWWYEELTAAV